MDFKLVDTVRLQKFKDKLLSIINTNVTTINNSISSEATARDAAISKAIATEVSNRNTELAKKSDIGHTHSNATTNTSGFMSATDKAKLDGIATGAGVQVNSDWNSTNGVSAILNKPTQVSAFQNDSGYLTSHQSLADYALKTDIPTVPTQVSAFQNDSGYLTSHQSLANYALKTDIPTIPTASTDQKGIVQLVNDLTTDSAEQALTAAQGKVLEDALNNLEDALNNLEDALDGYKTTQAARYSPTPNGTNLTTAFIDTISQNDNGEITATKKYIPVASTDRQGVVKLGDAFDDGDDSYYKAFSCSYAKDYILEAFGCNPHQDDILGYNYVNITPAYVSGSNYVISAEVNAEEETSTSWGLVGALWSPLTRDLIFELRGGSNYDYHDFNLKFAFSEVPQDYSLRSLQPTMIDTHHIDLANVQVHLRTTRDVGAISRTPYVESYFVKKGYSRIYNDAICIHIALSDASNNISDDDVIVICCSLINPLNTY